MPGALLLRVIGMLGGRVRFGAVRRSVAWILFSFVIGMVVLVDGVQALLSVSIVDRAGGPSHDAFAYGSPATML